MTLAVLETYIGKIIKYLREDYPDHLDWKHLNRNDKKAVPEFWKNLKPGVKKEIQLKLFHLLYVAMA